MPVQYMPAQKAADSLGISKRRVLEYVQVGILGAIRQRDPDNGQMAIQVSVTDVEKLREDRDRPRPQTPQSPPEKPSAAVKQSAAALPALLEVLAERAPAGWPPPLYLTEEQAVTFTGLGRNELRRCAKGAPRGPRGALVYRRADLEAL